LTNSSFSQTFVDSNIIKGIWRTNENNTLGCIDSFLHLNDYWYYYYFRLDTLFLIEHYKGFSKDNYSEMYKTEFIDSFNFKIKRIGNINEKDDKLESCRNVKAFIDTNVKFQGLFFSFSPVMSKHPPFSFEIDSVGNYYFITRKKLKRWVYKEFGSYSSGRLSDLNLKKLSDYFKTSLLDSFPSFGGRGLDAPYYHIDLKYNNRVKRFEGKDFPEYKYDFLNYMFELYDIMMNDSIFKVVEDSFKIESNKFQLRSNLKSKIGYPKLDIKIIDSSKLVINEISRMYSTSLTAGEYNYTILEDTLTVYKPSLIEIKSTPTNSDSVIIKIIGYDSRYSEPVPFWRLNIESKIFKSKSDGVLILKIRKSNSSINLVGKNFSWHNEKISLIPNANSEIKLYFRSNRLRNSEELIFKKRNGENGFYSHREYPLVLEE